MYMVYKGIGLPTRETENQDPVHALALKFIQYICMMWILKLRFEI